MVNINKISQTKYKRETSNALSSGLEKISKLCQTLRDMEYELKKKKKSMNKYFKMVKSKDKKPYLEIKPKAYQKNLTRFSDTYIERFEEMSELIKKFENPEFKTSIDKEKIIIYDFSTKQEYHKYVALLLNPFV